MDKTTIDRLGPIFPAERLIEKIPDDTQIVLIGDYYINTYHQQYLYLNMGDFAAAGYHYVFGQKKQDEPGARHVVGRMGYRPYHFQRFRHVNLNDDRDVREEANVSGDNYNAFYDAQNGAGRFKLLKAADRLGMGFSFIEDPEFDANALQNNVRMSVRVRYMADAATALMADKKRLLIHCGEDFLYSAPELDGVDHSLQELLQQRHFKTHTIAFVNEPGDMLTDSEETVAADYIQHADADAADFIDEFFRNQISNPDDLDDDNAFDTQPYFNGITQAFSLDARLATKQAGIVLPDRFIIFPQASFDHSNNNNEYMGAKFNPVVEDRYWNESWRQNAVPAQRLYKQRRRNRTEPH